MMALSSISSYAVMSTTKGSWRLDAYDIGSYQHGGAY